MNGADILEAMRDFRDSIEERFGRDAEEAHEEEAPDEGGETDPAAEAEESNE